MKDPLLPELKQTHNTLVNVKNPANIFRRANPEQPSRGHSLVSQFPPAAVFVKPTRLKFYVAALKEGMTDLENFTAVKNYGRWKTNPKVPQVFSFSDETSRSKLSISQLQNIEKQETRTQIHSSNGEGFLPKRRSTEPGVTLASAEFITNEARGLQPKLNSRKKFHKALFQSLQDQNN